MNTRYIKSEETGEKLPAKRFAKISFIGNDVALAKYLNPSLLETGKIMREYIQIFPFGCNNSQYKAVSQFCKRVMGLALRQLRK